MHEVTAGAGCSGYALRVNGVGIAPRNPTAVGVVGFSAVRRASGVLVRWRTASDARTLGYNVYREQAGRRVRLNPTLIAATRGPGTQVYTFLDRNRPARAIRYWLERVSVGGKRSWQASARIAGP